MEPEGSLPHSHVRAACPYPEPEQSSPCPPNCFMKIYFNIIHLHLSLQGYYCHQVSSPKPGMNLSSPLPIHDVHFPSHSSDLMTIFGEEHASWSSKLCNITQHPVTLSLRPKYFSQYPFSNTLNLCYSITVRDQTSIWPFSAWCKYSIPQCTVQPQTHYARQKVTYVTVHWQTGLFIT